MKKKAPQFSMTSCLTEILFLLWEAFQDCLEVPVPPAAHGLRALKLGIWKPSLWTTPSRHTSLVLATSPIHAYKYKIYNYIYLYHYIYIHTCRRYSTGLWDWNDHALPVTNVGRQSDSVVPQLNRSWPAHEVVKLDKLRPWWDLSPGENVSFIAYWKRELNDVRIWLDLIPW